MMDNEKGEEGAIRGADWEVVSLTASAYAAAPGSNDFDTINESKEQANIIEHESSAALFMSGHFVFPPSEHENLPIAPELREIHDETAEYNVNPEVVGDDNDDIHSVEFFDKESRISTHDMLADSESDALYSEVHKSGSSEPSDVNMDSPIGHRKPDEDEFDGSNLPCQAWWKRHATSLYRHATDANTFWSVVVAAAVMGLVVLGRRWQQDKGQLHQIRGRFSIADEKMSRMLGSIGRFKDLVGGHQRSSLLGGGASASF
ncbi:ATG8-interacting protein 1 [Canna indica]|uniref:ATG8-interacting protein 1 n=1 Tax=Canna indica TaxID=4628 RepID=A0AAQ3KJG8_9LILI|nr:ATG8-interacting protein 1 [Canna indica]